MERLCSHIVVLEGLTSDSLEIVFPKVFDISFCVFCVGPLFMVFKINHSNINIKVILPLKINCRHIEQLSCTIFAQYVSSH